MEGLALIIRALGECSGGGSGPYTGFSPQTSKNRQGGGWEEDKGRPWNVGSSSKALPMHFSLLRIKSRVSNDNDSHFYYRFIIPGWLSVSSPQRHLNKDKKCQVNILIEPSPCSVIKVLVDRCGASLPL